MTKNVNIINKKPDWFEYFFTMGAKQRKLISEWYIETTPETVAQRDFLKKVAMSYIACQHMYRIPIIEPSNAGNGKIWYCVGVDPCTFTNFHECANASLNFSHEYRSDLASSAELILWYAYRIANGDCSIEFICDDSSSAGNYKDSPKGIGKLAITGSMRVAGASDGIGNTYKITRAFDGRRPSEYEVSGGMYICSGKEYPVGKFETYTNKGGCYIGYYDGGVPVVTLHK